MDVLEFFNKITGDFEEAADRELKKFCDLSPGVISNDEHVARQIRSPHHLNENGDINPAAFSDAKDKGLSINRLSLCSEDDVHSNGLEEEGKQDLSRKWRYVGLSKASVGDVRDIMSANQEHRAFFVYDTALPNNVSHGDIVQLASEKTKVVGLAAGKRLRKKLKDVFESAPSKPETF